MIVLDTDHLTICSYADDPRYGKLFARMQQSSDPDFATAIVCVEEQMRGWLAKINSCPEVQEQIRPYARFQKLFDFLTRFRLLPLDSRAADEFSRLRKEKVRIGSMDLKIAAIALVHNALLLSDNLRDFRRVPGLRVESWIEI